MPKITLPDGSAREFDHPVTVLDVAASIGPGLAKAALAGRVDDALVDALHAAGFRIAVETNGTLPAHPGIDWICVSPKAGSVVVQRSGDELKLVWPQAGTDLDEVERWDFAHRLLQPMDDARGPANVEAAIAVVMARPHWRLSLQTHKYLGLR